MKRILLVATGGTIASIEDGRGLTPGLTGEELTRYVPQIDGLCELSVTQPMNIDSTNMRPADWMRIRDAIASAYDEFDGFVVLHGTDTMAYTAAALSYLVQNSPKPIVLTGSQQPMGSPFTDAKLNVYQSLLYALDDASRDVSIVFGGQVIAGTRARKQRTMSFNAFASVNFPELALVRGNRIVRAGLPTEQLGAAGMAGTVGVAGMAGAPVSSDVAGDAGGMSDIVGGAGGLCGDAGHVRFYDALDDRVCALKLTPGMNPGMLRALERDYDAVILETFGIGGIPDHSGYREAIFGWVDSGRTAVLTTQVPEEGLDLGVYEVGHAYADHPGILRGGDMTTEALVAKTMWVLGQTSDPAEAARLFYRPVNYDRAMD